VLEAAEHRAIAAQARERLAHELSDGVIQRLYAVGLLLGDTASKLPPDDPIHLGLRELDDSIETLRTAILDAQAQAQAQDDLTAPHIVRPAPSDVLYSRC
jgi:signal transduction histidine kinase